MCRVKQECQRINFVPVTWFLPDSHAVLLGFVSDSFDWSGGFYRRVPSTAVALYWTLWQSSLAELLNDFSVAYLSTEIAAFSMLSGTSGGSMGCVFTSQCACAYVFVGYTPVWAHPGDHLGVPGTAPFYQKHLPSFCPYRDLNRQPSASQPSPRAHPAITFSYNCIFLLLCPFRAFRDLQLLLKLNLQTHVGDVQTPHRNRAHLPVNAQIDNTAKNFHIRITF